MTTGITFVSNCSRRYRGKTHKDVNIEMKIKFLLNHPFVEKKKQQLSTLYTRQYHLLIALRHIPAASLLEE